MATCLLVLINEIELTRKVNTFKTENKNVKNIIRTAASGWMPLWSLEAQVESRNGSLYLHGA